MDVTFMDPETAKLAVEMQLADIAAIIDDLYFDEDDPDHDEIASFRMMERDMQRQLEILEGQVLTLNILKDEHEGRVAFAKLLEEEKQAVTDHQLAMSLAGMGIGHSKVKSSNDYEATLCDEEDSTRDEQWEMAKELYSAAFNRDGSERRSPRKTESVKAEDLEGGDKGGVLGSNALTKCIACMDVVATKDTITLDCDPEPHTYCRTCLTDLFKSAIYDTTLFPPRCCRAPISLEVSRAVLPKDLIKDFDIKVEELATPNPTYCSNAECAKFIQLKDIKGDVGTCVFCREETCVLCKCKSHGGLCPSDPHVQLLMDAAKRSKWQQCLRCKNMVELVTGCFHMTCRCSHQFCYLCGVRWKRCTCPRWDEDYLTRPAPVLQAAPPPPNAQGQGQGRCVVHVWARHYGGECQDCGAVHLPWVQRCAGCGLQSCWRCIHNRI